MQITKHIHALEIPFKIPIAPGKQIDRAAYVFLVFGETITLIDSGVAGAHLPIFDYIRKNGRNPTEVSMLILSHAHPDHIGAAKAIKEAVGCMVAAHSGEKPWIEDTEGQFKDRPVPGFHVLVGGPVAVDRLLDDGDTVNFGIDLNATVIHTPGHSKGSISLIFESEKALFSGDAVPLPNDLPIYENIVDVVASLRKLRAYKNAETLLSSWEDPIRGRENIEKRIDAGFLYLRRIHESVLKARHDGKENLMELCRQVVVELGLPPFAAMPLVAKAFASSIEAEKNGALFENM
jgi:hydroxyacylglutathione hydrolase